MSLSNILLVNLFIIFPLKYLNKILAIKPFFITDIIGAMILNAF